MNNEVIDLVEDIIDIVVVDNYDDTLVIAKQFIEALERKGYKIVKVDDKQPETVD